jgi:starch phosphorylase
MAGAQSQVPTAGGAEVVAYFSMEIGLEESIPTYSGGLGVLAGDMVRSAADMGVPLVAVSLLHRKGYFRQKLDAAGSQNEEPVLWEVAEHLSELAPRVAVEIEHRKVELRGWQYQVRGISGQIVPVVLLDADLPENSAEDRCLTDHLYGGDARYRLCQEVILGIGGVRMLRAVGYCNIRRFHMNEGHASLLIVELAYEKARERGEPTISREAVQAIKPLCLFTSHTPVAVGHDQFPLSLVARVITDYGRGFDERAPEFCLNGMLNMTYLALDHSHFVNVAKKHGEVARHMFAQRKIDSITNGVHGSDLGRFLRAIHARPPHPRLAPGQCQPALCARHPQAGAVGRAPDSQAGDDPQRERSRRCGDGPERLHHRFRAAGNRLEAR